MENIEKDTTEKYFDTLIVLGRAHFILTGRAEFALPENRPQYLYKAHFIEKQMKGIFSTLQKSEPNVIEEIILLTYIQKKQSNNEYFKNYVSGRFFKAKQNIQIGEACNKILSVHKELTQENRQEKSM